MKTILQTFAKLEHQMLMLANETLPENDDRNSNKPFLGGRSNMSKKDKNQLMKRQEVQRSSDMELQEEFAKRSIADFTNGNDFLVKLGINSIGENENICDFYKRFNEAVYSCREEDKKELNQQVINFYQNIDQTQKMFNSMMLPRQIMLGIMLNALKNDNDKREDFVKKLNLPQRTCYQYMDAANVVPYIEQDCVYNLGMMVLAGLGKYFKANENNYKDNSQSFHQHIINYTESPLKLETGKETEFCKEYNKRVAYYYYRYGFFAGHNIDDDSYKQLFNTDYEWTYREANRIKEAALGPKKAGSKEREVINKDGVNTEIRKLINGLADDKKAFKKRHGIDISCRNASKALEIITKSISDTADVSEENRENLEKLRKQLQECQTKLDSILNDIQ